MKKILALTLALCMIFALCACGQEATTAAAATEAATQVAEAVAEQLDYSAMSIDEIKAVLQTVNDGKLTVATSPDFAPYEFYALDADGNPTLAGFDVAIAQYIADFLGLELEMVPMDFDGVLLELANKSIDLGVAGLSPDPSRMDAMDFSDVYYAGGQSFCTVQSKAANFTSLEDTNNVQYSIGAQTGSIQMDLANQYSPDADIVAVTKVTDIIAMLLNDKLDGGYIETAVAQTYAKNYPDLAVVLDVPYDVAGSAIGISKGNEALVAGVNLAIKAALADGSMDAFVAAANELASGDIYEGLLENK